MTYEEFEELKLKKDMVIEFTSNGNTHLYLVDSLDPYDREQPLRVEPCLRLMFSNHGPLTGINWPCLSIVKKIKIIRE